MKKWYFSEDGQVSGPHSLADSSKLLSTTKSLYGWNPSLKHWLPVEDIPELKGIVSQNKPDPKVTNELIARFVKRKRDLNKKVKLIDDAIRVTDDNLEALNRVINKYIQLTDGLSDEVKANIDPIKKKKSLLSKQLGDLTKALSIAKSEIIEVVKEFGELVLHNDSSDTDNILDVESFSESQIRSKENKSVNLQKEKVMAKGSALEQEADKEESAEKSSISLVSNTGKAKSIDDKVKAEVVAKVDEKGSVETLNKAKVEKAVLDNESTKQSEEKPEVDKVNPKSNLFTLPELFNMEKPAYSGVKSKIKSVFQAKDEEPTMRLSDRLKEIEPTSGTLSEVSEPDSEYLDEGEQKKKRRRRRR